MAFCPNCRSEYRPGFTSCPPCGVELVDSLDGPAAEHAAAAPVGGNPAAGMVAGETILEGPGDPDAELEILTGRLSEAGIRFEVEEDLENRKVRREGLGGPLPLPWYRIHVEAGRIPEARAIFEEEAAERLRAIRELRGEEEVSGRTEVPPAVAEDPTATGIVVKMIWLLAIVAVVAFLAWRLGNR